MSYAGFLDPSTIAVYGASERATSPAAHILRNLIGQGFGGGIAAINPKYETIAGRPCHRSQVAGGIAADLAVIVIPPHAVPTAIQDCAAVGTRAAIVISAGFEDGSGPASFARLIETAQAGSVRFLGPNCLGLVRPKARLNATFQPALPPAGGLALISQSGAVCSGLADMAEAEGLGFSLMLSVGNALDLGMADAVDMAAQDPSTSVILAYIEGVRRGTRFRSALREATRTKPVIVLKAGRHAEGAAAATTHTGALIGSDRVFSAVLRDCGAVQVATLGEMIETARLLHAWPRVAGGRLAVVTNGGGVGVLSADRMADRGLALTPLPEALANRLDPHLSANWSRRNPVDIVGDATAIHYAAALNACLESDAYDAALVLLSPQSMTAPEAVAELILEAHHRSTKPVMTCFLGGPSVASARAKLRRQGIADFRLPEHGVQAYAQALRASEDIGNRTVPRLTGGPATGPAPSALAAFAALPDGLLGDAMSRKLLVAAGVPCPIPKLAKTPDQAVSLLVRFGAPVVLKIASPDISHKSEVDGVRLNLATPDRVAAAFAEIVTRAQNMRGDARIDGVTVEPMVSLAHPRELLLGLTRDPAFGPALTFGAGGTLVELLDDVGTALLPLGLDRARRLISGTKIARLLGPYRNLKPVDQDMLAAILVAVSDLAVHLPNIVEMDINPLIASPEGFCAVDARIRVAASVTPMLSCETDAFHRLGDHD